jgi:acetolactate decarboxylase
MRNGSTVALSLILFGSIVSGGAPVAGKQPLPAAKRVVWQSQPFIALANGHFQGMVTVDEAKRHGNLGIGALDRIDGEILVLDGVLYQFPAAGGVRKPSGNTRLAFAMMARFVPGKPIELPPGTSLKDLYCFLDPKLPTLNAYYALRLEGKFSAVKTRTFPIQKEPFQPVCELDPPPPVFEFSDIAGTMVGFRPPSYAADVSGPAYHLHFLARDQRGGGHVLDLVVEKATITFDRIDGLALDLPTDKAFAEMDLATAACPSAAPPVCPAAQP